MNSIDRFKSLTTCRDCAKRDFNRMNDNGYDWFFCGLSPDTKPVTADHRCDSGLWLARASYSKGIYPMDLWKMIRLLCDHQGFADKIEIVPREEWPEVEEL